MTATLPPGVHPPEHRHIGPRVNAGDGDRRPASRGHRGSAVTTLLTAAGSALAMMPLAAIFTDWTWLYEAWLGLACVAVVLAVLRVGRRAMFVDDAIGIVVLLTFLVVVHLSDHAWGGFIPTTATMHDLSALTNRASDLIATSRPPVQSSPSLRLLTTASLVGAALLIDVIAVVLRARAVAGLVVLALVTAGTSIARAPIGIIPFVFATAGYVLILAAGAARERRDWVDAAPVHGSEKGAVAAHGFTAARVATLAMVVALIAPIFTPIAAHTRLSELFSGSGGDGGVALSPFAKLQGSLNQNDPTPLLRVTMDPNLVEPYYLRDIVLDTYSSQHGWTASDSGQRKPLTDSLRQEPPAGPLNGTAMAASVQVLDLTDSHVPTFGTLTGISGLGSSWRWNSTTATVSGGVTKGGNSYRLNWVQPEPSVDQLRGAPATSSQDLQRWLKLPDDVPRVVKEEARSIVAGKATPFDQALALHHYFLDPLNGFQYSITTTSADTGDGLSDFLINRRGFCQQYAGAMAVMARALDLPSRIVLGYTHDAPDEGGAFTVTSHDAHAWVEIYFDGLGWVPFDPTPLSGNDAARAVPLGYAPGNGSELTPDDPTGSQNAATPVGPEVPQELVPDEILPDSGPLTRAQAQTTSRTPQVLLAGGIVLIVLLTPAAARIAQRRRRIALARRTATVWPWWEEFDATAQDLRVGWPSSATLREVPAAVRAALRARGDDDRDLSALTALTRSAERERFGPPARLTGDPQAGRSASQRDTASQRDAATGAQAVRDLRQAMGVPARVLAWWVPASTLRPSARWVARLMQRVAAAPGGTLRKLRRAAS